jgi:uncharacterized damage-inducible protein DinB
MNHGKTGVIMKVKPWIERKFDSELPTWMIPHILERLEGTPARVESKLKKYRSIATIRSPDGKWSIQEHAGHLADSDILSLKRFKEFAAGLNELTAADMTGRKTRETLYNQRAIDDILENLSRARKEILDLIVRQDESYFTRRALHPRLQRMMTPVDLMNFFAEHDDYHLAKMTELAAMFVV